MSEFQLISAAGEMVEQIRYEAYGTPIAMPRGDVNMNGKVDSSDPTQISIWDSGGTYDVRGDLDLDGDVNTTDYNISDNRAGTRLGELLSSLLVAKGAPNQERTQS